MLRARTTSRVGAGRPDFAEHDLCQTNAGMLSSGDEGGSDGLEDVADAADEVCWC